MTSFELHSKQIFKLHEERYFSFPYLFPYPRGAYTLLPVLSWYCKKENVTVKGEHKAETAKIFKGSFMTQLRKKGQ